MGGVPAILDGVRRGAGPALLALLLGLGSAAPVAAGPYENGEAAFTRGSYAAALRWWRQAAAESDPEAEVGLGTLYALGLGVPHDDAEAARWFRQAAERGLPLAQVRLADLYRDGQGVPKSPADAIVWLRKAAAQGSAAGPFNAAARMAVASFSTVRPLRAARARS